MTGFGQLQAMRASLDEPNPQCLFEIGDTTRQGCLGSAAGAAGFFIGANRGIGLEIARQLAQAGVHVIIGARDPDRGRAAVAELSSAGLRAQFVPFDLKDHGIIAAAARTIQAEHGRLDILVNNAGILDAADGPPTTGSPEAARIVNLSSFLDSLTLNGDPTSPFYSARLIGYNASKAALNMLTVQLAEELRGTPIVINSVSPGYVKTDLTGHTGFMTPEEGAKLPVEYALLGEGAVSGRFVEPSGQTPW
ncbi:SDR family NAD(P)-dependent oxidoreductase [Erwinia sp. V71]|uniref:SDR family NAD(P)-dependent oxidoreductase n=1 Tax=Erwinia sp. V71 TaxID=3369424 RepID=UPI003F5DF2D3